MITQIDKFGTLLHAWSEQTADSRKIYQIRTLLGKRDDPLLNIYARQIIERLSAQTNKHLLLSISLRNDGRDSHQFQSIINKVFSEISFA